MVTLLIKIVILLVLAQGVVNGLNYINNETLSYVIVMLALMMLLETTIASIITTFLGEKEEQ